VDVAAGDGGERLVGTAQAEYGCDKVGGRTGRHSSIIASASRRDRALLDPDD
jgi:hypothetical protein